MYIYIYTYIHIHAHMYVCMCACIYIYIYMTYDVVLYSYVKLRKSCEDLSLQIHAHMCPNVYVIRTYML